VFCVVSGGCFFLPLSCCCYVYSGFYRFAAVSTAFVLLFSLACSGANRFLVSTYSSDVSGSFGSSPFAHCGHRQAMAEHLLAQVGASRSILTALKGRPGFTKVSCAEKTKLCNALQQIPLSSTELAQVLDAVMTVDFAAEDTALVVDTIADILGQQGSAAAPMAKANRSSMQSWENVVHFLTESVWQKLQEGNMDVLLGFLIRMGLRHPSEPTSATIALVCIHQAEGDEKLAAMSSATRLEFVKTVKHALKSKTKFVTAPPAFIQQLPATPAQLKLQYPLVYESIFAAELPVPCKISEMALAHLKAGTRMRAARCKGRR
jgi:hypothetical protein